jgi:branched-chain amino acid transport system ATP-binding protein
MGALLEVRDLSLRFGGIQALAGVGVTIGEGETLAVIGPNGSGKTSLFNCVTGIYRPTAGTVTLGGETLLGLSPDAVTRRGVARTFQNLRLFLNLSVIDNLLVGRHLHFRRSFLQALLRVRREEIRHRGHCEVLIEFLNLEPYRKSRVADCPYGVQKRVELGRALAAEPQLLLLDEPMAGMNVEEKEDMCRFILDVNGEFGTTIALIEHDMGVVMDISDRVAVLDYGRKIADGTPDQVRTDRTVLDAYLGVAHA